MTVANQTLVNAYYWAVLGRTPDAEGFQFWVGKMNEGLSGEQVIRLFLNSAERLQSQPEDESTSIFIDGCYQDLLGRTADAEGKAYWTSRLDQLETTHHDARAGVVAEMVNYLTSTEITNSDQLAFHLRLDEFSATAPHLTLRNDSGSSATDGITNDNIINIIVPETVERWDITADGGLTWHEVNHKGASLLLPDGFYSANTVQVRYADAEGEHFIRNESAWTIDTQGPEPLTLNYYDGGDIPIDKITKDGYISVDSLIGDTSWRYSTDSGATWTAGDAKGGFAVGEGYHTAGTILIDQKDIAGNSTITANTEEYTVDNTPPILLSVGQKSFLTTLPSNMINISYGPVQRNDFYATDTKGSDGFNQAYLQDVTSGEKLHFEWIVTAGRYQNVWKVELDGQLESGHEYSLYLPSGFIEDIAGNQSPEITLLGSNSTFIAA